MAITGVVEHGMVRSNRVEEALKAAVDRDFYLFAYPDLPVDIDAAEHYGQVGWREGRDPNSWFNTAAYLADYPHVRENGTAPLFYYLLEGRRAGHAAKASQHAPAYYRRGATRRREAEPAAEGVAPSENAGPSLGDVMNAIRSEFDVRYYEAVYPDVVAAGVPALQHFSEQGWREGRDPNAWFSVKGYLHAHPDVADAQINPFFHYVVAGRNEGRVIKHDLGFRYDILAVQGPLEERISVQRGSMPPAELLPPHELRRALQTLTRSGGARIHISISHDDYREISGGVQLCIRREASRLMDLGIDHIHLFPAYPSLFTTSDESDAVAGIVVNGSLIGTFDMRTAADIMDETVGAMKSTPEVSFAVHSLLGHHVPNLIGFLEAAAAREGYFWLHDYSSVCASHILMRNDVEFCGAPKVDSAACGVCIYKERRKIQIRDHAELFDRFPLTVLGPSNFALETWKHSTSLEYREAVAHPHCKLVARDVAHTAVASGPLRVAFLGHPNAHKGWPIFKKLAIEFSRDDRYRFYHLGQGEQVGLPVVFKSVTVANDKGAAMIQSVEEEEIDIALILSMWPETFCFTAYEAIAGGAAVLTSGQSGNVARTVSQLGHGLVVPDENAVYESFSSGSILNLKRGRRAVETFNLEYSNMTADFLSLVRA